MNGSIGWPDIVIIAILVIAAIKGFARGFISELGGVVAVFLALAVPLYYNGMADTLLQHAFKLSRGSAHITGMVLTGLIIYVIIIALLRLLARFTTLPVLGAGNAVGGGVVGIVKGAVLLWVVLFIALLFPLSQQIRTDLHKSHLVVILAQENARIDDTIYGKLPDMIKPFVKPILDRQQV